MNYDLLSLLLIGPVRVTFTKVDGTERKMLCTQNLEYVPEDNIPNSKDCYTTKQSGVIRVFDLEKKAWRSFREDSVISYKDAFNICNQS